jgi:hypothetical protein
VDINIYPQLSMRNIMCRRAKVVKYVFVRRHNHRY